MSFHAQVLWQKKLARLRPAFKKDGTVTAANASGINDGAAAVVIMSREKADELGITPLVVIKAYGVAGVDPAYMGIGPVPAVTKALNKAGITIEEVDLIEANEAFAAQSIAVARDLNFDMTKVNVNGGAIALGHPIGASGTRILVYITLCNAESSGQDRPRNTLCRGRHGCRTDCRTPIIHIHDQEPYRAPFLYTLVIEDSLHFVIISLILMSILNKFRS